MYMTIAYMSDKTQKRGVFCVIFGTISLVGYAILISNTPAGVHYFGYVVCATYLSTQILTTSQLLPHRCRSLHPRRFALGLVAQQQPKIRQKSHSKRSTTDHWKCFRHYGAFHLVRLLFETQLTQSWKLTHNV